MNDRTGFLFNRSPFYGLDGFLLSLSESYRALLAVVCCVILFSTSRAQPFGNEWIDYNQTYYKFQISTDGVYRIDYATLVNAGLPVLTIDPRNFQLFGRGEEQYIYIDGEGDGTFDPGDFIEFYANGNNGWLDERLYGSASKHPNPYYSLFNDTATYYLSWNASVSNRRMTIETDVNFPTYVPSSYFFKQQVDEFHTTYFDGETHLGGATDVAYVPTEGWFDGAFNLGGSRVKNVKTNKAYTAGPAATVEWVVLGSSNHQPTSPDHHLNVQFAGTTFDTIYEGYQLLRKSFTVAPSNLGSNTTSFTFQSINDLGSGADRSAISYITVKYPHLPDLDNQKSFRLSVPDHPSQSKTRLDFTNFNTSSSTVRYYDLSTHRRIPVTTSGGTHQCLIPNTGGEKDGYITSDANIGVVNQLLPVNGTGMFTDLMSLERDSAYLILTHPSLLFVANTYANYRQLKGHDVVVLDATELYDQFGYGVNSHPLSIRNAMNFILNNWQTPPQNLFLIGKSIRARLYRKSTVDYGRNLVSSMGNPASDIYLTAGLNGTILEPAIATGRLSASRPDHVMWYLSKVMEHESNPNALWMKTILHFAGGSSKAESDRFSNYLTSYEHILEDTLFGGFAHTFKKSTTAPIQITLSDSIAKLINQGVSLMTFFGHASASGGFDQNIDEPGAYSNKGKYPVLVANSCFAGDIHGTAGLSTSEEFILIENRGMIGFIASTDLGLESVLNLYSSNLFRNIGQTNYGRSLGSSMKKTIAAIQGNGTNTSIRSTCFEMTLHGDPAVTTNFQTKPDYSVTESSVFFTPNDVTAEVDSFDINLVITNLGRATAQEIAVTIRRTYPNSSVSDTVYERIIPGVRYRDTLQLRMPVDIVIADGINRFDINVDALATVDELREDNNFVTANLFIRSGNVVPVLPYPYAIVPVQGVTLMASTGYPFETIHDYVFELDTTDLFNSPLKQTTVIRQEGGVLKWQPALLNSMPNRQVYFWRTSRQASDPIDLNWKESSFQFIPTKRGWSQDHFFQFKNDDYLFLNVNRPTRRFNFVNSLRKLTVVTISTTTIGFLSNVDYKIDSDRIEWGGCGLGSAIHVAVLDSLTFEPWGTPFGGVNLANDFGQLNKNGNCGKNRVQNFFIFNANNAAHLAGLKDMLTNKVPDGHYVVAWTWVKNDFSKWDAIDPAMRQVFVNLGASKITSVSNDSLPYIFFVKKGDPSSAKEVLGAAWDEFITLKTDLQNNATFGTIGSEIIGPASSWDSLIWKHFSLENPSADSLVLKVSGLNKAAQESLLIPSIAANNLERSISQIDAKTYPYLKLGVFKADDSLQTAPQLDKWQVMYQGVPEVAINPMQHFSFHADTLQEGDLLRFSVAIENIGDYDMDSLLIDYYILDNERKRRPLPYPKQKGLAKDSLLITTIEYPTHGLQGLNTLVIDVNPNEDQPEQTHVNNIGQLPFFVLSDNANPLLDVTFDGVHILDGDIVSPQAEIIIQLSDENKFLALDDTADFRLWLTDPSGKERQLWFNTPGQQIDFIPASLPNNTAKISYHPNFVYDGLYRLRVQASDKSQNESGDIDYQISFEVINRSTITNLLNYPNPFTTSTRFVFVLTGSKIPQQIQIQIMTITGKLVKTIDAYDIGPLRIGRNITEYAWNGLDDYGDRLANGVYLYRVKAKIDGENIEHRPTSADKYFKKGFGKMYLMK